MGECKHRILYIEYRSTHNVKIFDFIVVEGQMLEFFKFDDTRMRETEFSNIRVE